MDPLPVWQPCPATSLQVSEACDFLRTQFPDPTLRISALSRSSTVQHFHGKIAFFTVLFCATAHLRLLESTSRATRATPFSFPCSAPRAICSLPMPLPITLKIWEVGLLLLCSQPFSPATKGTLRLRDRRMSSQRRPAPCLPSWVSQGRDDLPSDGLWPGG